MNAREYQRIYKKEYMRVYSQTRDRSRPHYPTDNPFVLLGRKGGRPRVPPTYPDKTAAENGLLAIKKARNFEARKDKLDPNQYHIYQPEKGT